MKSAVNLDNILFTRAKWQLRLLIPSWTFQLLVLLCLMGIFAYRLVETVELAHNNDGHINTVEVVWEGTNVGFSTIALVCTILEIAKLATEKLTPFAMLVSCVIKQTLALAMLSLDITAHITQIDYEYAIVGLSLDCGFLAVVIVHMVYTVKIYRRLLKYEEYQLTEGPKQPRQYYNDVELGNSITITAAPSDKGKGKASADYSENDDNESLRLQREVDGRISAGFEWSSSSEPRSTVVISSGTVPSAKVSPSENDMRRSKSFYTERGFVIRGEEYVSDEDDDDVDTVRGEGYRDSADLGSGKDTMAPDEHEGDDDTKALLSESGEGGLRKN